MNPLVLVLNGLVAPIDTLAVATMGVVQLGGVVEVDGVAPVVPVVVAEAVVEYTEYPITPQPGVVGVRVAPRSVGDSYSLGMTDLERWARKNKKNKIPVTYADARPVTIRLSATTAEASTSDARTVSYPAGVDGAMTSAQVVAAVAAKAKIDKTVREWAVRALRKAGLPSSTVDQARAIFEATRSFVTPVRDPVGTEMITHPADLLASNEPAGDCDDQVLLFASAAESVGIPVSIVLQLTQDDAHLLAAVWDGSRWVYADVARRELPFGSRIKAQKEIWVSIANGARVARTGTDDAAMDMPKPSSQFMGTFVGVGDVSMPQDMDSTPVYEQVAQAGPAVPWWVTFLAGTVVGALAAFVVMKLSGDDKDEAENLEPTTARPAAALGSGAENPDRAPAPQRSARRRGRAPGSRKP